MKAVKITAPAHFALFLIAKSIPFVYSNEEDAYYITNTGNPEKLKSYCAKSGVREADLKEMKFSAAVLDCENHPTEINDNN